MRRKDRPSVKREFPAPEQFVTELQRGNQRVDLIHGVIQPKGRPACISISGMAQCVPARTAMPRLSRMVEMSCAWAAPCSVKLKIAPLPAELPCTFSQFNPASRSRA
jgi:hypothetical protein